MGRAAAPVVLGLSLSLLCGGLIACGGRTPLHSSDAVDAGGAGATDELCNRLDDDGDGDVDEDFRDPAGRYLDDDHCGGCGRACDRPIGNADELGCELLAEAPTCVARSCDQGFGLSAGGGCAPLDSMLCLPCRDDGDCGSLVDARCVKVGGEQRCTRPCVGGCPEAYVCFAGEYCIPEGESCTCEPGSPDFDVACSSPAPDGALCAGQAECRSGRLSSCEPPDEICDGIDDDCDGVIDEGFLGELGTYSEDARNCGACGADCTSDEAAGVELTCGGDPFAPSCVILCPDSLDGIQPGDALDADRDVGSGCECEVRALIDSVGAPPAEGQLDSNCDGADGELLSSFYVAIGGSDGNPGSPTLPLRTIQAAIDRARDSLGGDRPRPHIYVASGTYTESLILRGGVQLHGGYRSDFLSLDPDGFEVVVVAPADTMANGGAALSIRETASLETLVESFTFRGRDARESGGAAIGVEIVAPGTDLTLRGVRIRTGKPGAGVEGQAGAAGGSPAVAAGDGQPQRPALEDVAHACIPGDQNVVRGGRGGSNVCAGIDVSGGAGGSPGCPSFSQPAPSGQPGRRAGAALGGPGGAGGRDMSGPIEGSDSSCDAAVCCGLADFVVPSPFELPTAGLPGDDGTPGLPGGPCTDPIGGFVDTRWSAGQARAGSSGEPGGGAGGGGSGGGAQMAFFPGMCEWADGLAGAGGGGGAGGCGGTGGMRGGSGGAAIGLLIRAATSPDLLPRLERVEIVAEDGAPGGRGGAGGDGGQGGSGGFGGRLDDALRTTPPLAGPLPGERGGPGGDGGAGGGGGGGCGGSSLGVWITGLGAVSEPGYASGNTIVLGEPGAPGSGGGGAVPGTPGAAGLTREVLAR